MRFEPRWAVWRPSEPYSLGVEEEVMLLDPEDWSLAPRSAEVLRELPESLRAHAKPEMNMAALELNASPCAGAAELLDELVALRRMLEAALKRLGLRAASAGTHPLAVWQETVVSASARHRAVHRSMRELARREPTFALHVHVGVADADRAIELMNRLRSHLPLLLALSGNSPFWQGRNTGLASARTPLFQAFPRTGIPRRFDSFEHWAEAVGVLVRNEAIPDPSHLWWDIRPQPRLGTVEVRILDAQLTASDTCALAALVQCLARLELEGGYSAERPPPPPEVLDENRFVAARDGMAASFIDMAVERRMPAALQLEVLLEACAPHARALDCETELDGIRRLAQHGGASRQLAIAESRLQTPRLVAELATRFTDLGTRPADHDPVVVAIDRAATCA